MAKISETEIIKHLRGKQTREADGLSSYRVETTRLRVATEANGKTTILIYDDSGASMGFVTDPAGCKHIADLLKTVSD